MTARNDELSPALQLLKNDHDRVRSLAERFEASPTSLERRVLAHQIFIELDVHALVEERLLYPALATKGGEAARQLVDEAIQEHRQVKNEIALLKTVALGDAGFGAGVQAVIAAVEHHAAEEEAEMFPLAEAALSGELEELATRMEALKQELLSAKSQPLAA